MSDTVEEAPLLAHHHEEGLAVVYLDADALVMQSLEDLFQCPGMCGIMRHGERLNTGVLVVTPSSALFAALLAAVPTMASYTGCVPCAFSVMCGCVARARARERVWREPWPS